MDNKILRVGLKNILYVFIAQSISLVLGISKALILPITLGMTNFGYWQVYLLYLSYVGLFALGFNDGIYLRYGKYNYEELPKPLFRSSIRVFMLFQLFIMLFVSGFILLESDHNKQIALLWVVFNIPISSLTGVLIYILQITNQMKKFSFFSIIDKTIIVIIILGLFFVGLDNFIVIIVADTSAKLLVLFLLINSCKSIIFGKGSKLIDAYKETMKNMNVGVKLMIANICGMLVIGLGRLIVERFESVEKYAVYSFAISTTNLVLIFVTAMGIVIYPTLNRLSEEKYANYFNMLNEIMSVLLFGLLILYFPLYIFVKEFMSEYIMIFEYLQLIFLIIYVQGKMQIVINPFYKLLRKENAMLKANLSGLLIAASIIIPTYIIFNSIYVIALGTLISMCIRLYLSEFYLKKVLKLRFKIDTLLELFFITLFVCLMSISNITISFLGFIIIYSLYLLFYRKKLVEFIRFFKKTRK